MAFKKVVSGGDAAKYKFEKVGQTLEGYLISKGTITIEDKDVSRYVVKTDNDTVAFLGSHQLNEGLAPIAEGTRIRVTFLGAKKLAGGRRVNNFDIEYNDEDTMSA